MYTNLTRNKDLLIVRFFHEHLCWTATAAEHAGEYKVVAKNEGGEAVSCADLRVVQPLPDVGTFAPFDHYADTVNVVSCVYYFGRTVLVQFWG